MQLNLNANEAARLVTVLTRVANGELSVDVLTEKVCIDIVTRLNTEIL
jgi:hypothetical protein